MNGAHGKGVEISGHSSFWKFQFVSEKEVIPLLQSHQEKCYYACALCNGQSAGVDNSGAAGTIAFSPLLRHGQDCVFLRIQDEEVDDETIDYQNDEREKVLLDVRDKGTC